MKRAAEITRTIGSESLKRLQAALTGLMLLAALLPPGLSFGSAKCCTCSMSCCVRGGHCCCSAARRHFEDAQAGEDGKAALRNVDLSRPCPPGCPTTGSSLRLPVADNPSTCDFEIGEPSPIQSLQEIELRYSEILPGSFSRAPPAPCRDSSV